MKLHEFQAKSILASYGIPVPKGAVASTLKEAEDLFHRLGGGRAVLKAQVHVGGRGKAGGVKRVGTREEFLDAAFDLIGKRLVTAQTGPQGVIARRILVEQETPIAKEFYLGIVIDRSLSLPVVLASATGGVDIEEIAKRDPSALLKEAMDPRSGPTPSQSKGVARHLGLVSSLEGPFHSLLSLLSNIFFEKDLSLLEINPFVLTQANTLVALDCKMSVDDNALFRHPELATLRDREEEHPKELLAQEVGISYIPLDGNIGCLVNGAGLAMATMDVIKLYGGSPANFLDVGGGADQHQVREAFKILLSDEKIKAVLVNIFGGIMKCDVIAQGILGALKEAPLRVPLVVRLEGTNVEIGKKIIAESGLKIIPADTMDDAAMKVVRAAKGDGK
ncbi:MAG: ADP-forming succinate--CoA ligase subunit beta [Candidatus Omnitrophica bacterium]|nr:ADP-forming succinate--CoA ligase subunit beta [Candidatus Omnitrophota bacterium]